MLETRGLALFGLGLLALLATPYLGAESGPFLLDRGALSTGKLWTLATTHLLHANASHLALNLVALAVLQQLFGQTFAGGAVWIACGAIALTVGLGVLATTDFAYYLGLSGVLHGLWAWGAVRSHGSNRTLSILALVLLVAKLTREALSGGDPALSSMIGIAVATESHVLGAAAGLACALVATGIERSAKRA